MVSMLGSLQVVNDQLRDMVYLPPSSLRDGFDSIVMSVVDHGLNHGGSNVSLNIALKIRLSKPVLPPAIYDENIVKVMEICIYSLF